MLTNHKRILMFFAHPDDETLGAGGAIAKLSDAGKTVHVAISHTGIHARNNKLSNNNKVVICGEGVEELRQNCREALAILGVEPEHIYLGDFSDNEADKHSLLSLIHWLEPIIEKIRPEVVFTHHRHCTNIEHQYCHEAAVGATRPSENSHIPLICCEIPSSTGYLKPTQWEPNLYVSLSESDIRRKIKAMETYKGEARPYPHPRSPEVLEALGRVRGSESGFHFAEAFMVNRMFG
ncbi:MAG: PIG-L family deacetylase [Deltaproteobacteria bacterium]|jgi:LmbE family N-acetylglucosaminyl deacetylase|nr:PIG-L family deacetylase [Deltaproteobacteria bacterium]